MKRAPVPSLFHRDCSKRSARGGRGLYDVTPLSGTESRSSPLPQNHINKDHINRTDRTKRNRTGPSRGHFITPSLYQSSLRAAPAPPAAPAVVVVVVVYCCDLELGHFSGLTQCELEHVRAGTVMKNQERHFSCSY